MANHSYVQSDRKISVEEAERLLRKIVNAAWGDRVVVEEYTPEHLVEAGRRSYRVFIPGTEIQGEKAAWKYMKASNEPFGFLVWFHPKTATWEFRHPPNNWEWWAQDKVQHAIAEALDVKTLENDGPTKVDTSVHKATYLQHITRNFKQPYKEDDRKWFDRLLATAPEGFRE
jgi:hypothetical protein